MLAFPGRVLVWPALLLALLGQGCVIGPATQEVSRSAPRHVERVSVAETFELTPRPSGLDLAVQAEHVTRTTRDEALEQTVTTAHWEYDPGADGLELYNPFIAMLLFPLDAFGLFECGVDGDHHPFSLWETAWVSTIPFVNVRRSAGGFSPFFGSTPSVTSEVVRTDERHRVEEKREPIPGKKVEVLLGERVALLERTDAAGRVVFSIIQLRQVPWEQGAACLQSEGTRAPLPAELEGSLRRVRAEDLYARAKVATEEERFDAALEAVRGARALGHPLAPPLEARIGPLAALARARAALRRSDLDGAVLALEPVANDPLTRELAARVLARARRRTILRARAHIAAGRPVRALEVLEPLLALRGLPSTPEGEAARVEAKKVANAAKQAWARRCIAQGAKLEPAERLLLDAFALALSGCGEARDAFSFELARATSGKEPDPARFLAATHAAETFEARCAGSCELERLREETGATLLLLGSDPEAARRTAELVEAVKGATLTRPEEAPLDLCATCQGGGLAPGRIDLEPCRTCAGSGLARR
jgi:hypothetical protein